MNLQVTAGEGLNLLEHLVGATMTESESPLAPLFSTQRTLVDRTIETQRDLSQGGLTVTRQSAKTLAGVVPDDEARATERIDDLFDDIESTQDDLFDDLQELAERGVDGSEDFADRSFGLLGDGFDRTQDAAEEAADAATDTVDSVEAVSGIGPTYAERLVDAGIETTADLGSASADAVADAAGVSETRAGEWIESAGDRA